MKKIIMLGLSLVLTAAAFAQKIVPTIKEGSIMNFNVDYQGQIIDFMLTVKSLGDPIKMDWDVQGTGGIYEMTKQALEQGTMFNTNQPVVGGTTKMRENETFCLISKAAIQSLLKNKAFTYSALNFTLKDTEPFRAGTQDIDALHATASNGKTEIWVMNNPDFPVVLQIKGNPNGVNFTSTGIKE